MAFDPSVIASIGDNTGDVAGAQAKAFQIKDLIDNNQLNQMKLKAVRQEGEDAAKVKDLAGKYDQSTVEGQHEFVAEVGKTVGPKAAMDLQRGFGDARASESQANMAEFELAAKKALAHDDAVLSLLSPLKAQYEHAITSTEQGGLGMSPQQATMMLQPAWVNTIQKAKSMKVPGLDEPVLGPQQMQFIQQNPTFNPMAIDSVMQGSKEGRAQLEAHRKERAEAFKEGMQTKRDAQNDRRLDIADRRADAAEARAGGSGRKADAGFEWNDPNDPSKGEHAIKGGPKDPATTAAASGREAVFQGRVGSATLAAAQAIHNITRLPVGSSMGTLGYGRSPGESIFGSLKARLVNNMAPQQVKDYTTIMSGVNRNLASIESSGLAPPGSLTHAMDAVAIKAGDNGYDVLRKMAEMRQIVERGVDFMMASPRLPTGQRDKIQEALTKLQKDVPFTNDDVTDLEAAHTAGRDVSIQQLIRERGLANKGPAAGTVEDGYTFKGGDPKDKANWTKN